MRLLDPRFRYVPAVATDVAATWRRFGFDSRRNEERRALLKQRVDQDTRDGRGKTAVILALVSIKPQC